MKTLRNLGTMAAVAATAIGIAVAGPARMTFEPLGETNLVPISMTADGSKIVGSAYFGAPVFTWTADEGVVIIGGGCDAGQPMISGDGSTIFGTACDEFGQGQAAKWVGGEDWQVLGSVPGAVPCGTSLSSGWGVNYDGSKGVGLVWLAQICRAHAGMWDLDAMDGAVDLGSTVPDRATRANAISGDGHVIAGWQDDAFGSRQGAIWVDGVEQDLLTADGKHVGEVFSINYDGSVMTGTYIPYGESENGWVWTAQNGFTVIQGLAFFPTVLPLDATEDGSIVVGMFRERLNGTTRPFVYQHKKATLLADILRKKGLAQGWDLRTIAAISDDGTTLTGWGLNPDGYIEGYVIHNFR